MCRSVRVIFVCVAVLMLASPVSGSGDDAVAAWLERHDLKELLAVHLEQQLEATLPGSDGRSELVLRLADIYAELLETVDDPERREHLEVRSRRLLALADDDGAEELRLALLRASYRTAERIAEDHRLRRAGEDDLQRARVILDETVPKLRDLNRHLERGARLADRRLGRASDRGAAVLSGRLDRLRELHGRTSFLAAWAIYHKAWLHDRPDDAREAEDLFAEILMADSARPQPDEISVDLRAVEPFARAILGMALCKSLTASSATALRWVELLDHESTYEPIRRQTDVWKILILLEHGQYRQVREMLRPHLEADEPVPLAWLRMVAAHALEAPTGQREARSLVQMTVAQLAGRGEMDQILDLAQRYGVEAMGDRGFALRYVNGLLSYRQARDLHGDDRPTTDEEINQLYRDAVDHLAAGLNEPDVAEHPVAAAASRRLMAWALYFLGQYIDAADAFERAEADLSPNEAAEALWMAIVCLDRVTQSAAAGESLVQRREKLIEQFLQRYPRSERAAELVLRQSIEAERISNRTVNELLAVSPGHPSYSASRQRAAQELYQRFRESSGSARIAYADDYLGVAAGLIIDEALDDDASIERAMLHIRRILEVSLSDGVGRTSAARQALEQFDRLIVDGHVDESAFADEIAFRRLQHHLYSHEPMHAMGIADQLWEDDARSIWSRLASRAVFQFAHRQRSDDEATLTMKARYGGRVIREFEDDAGALRNPQVLAYHAAVGEALLNLWEKTHDEQRGRAALFLYRRMLDAEPRNARFLRAAAVLASGLGDPHFAAECWRLLSVGSEAGSERWFEARFNLIALLAELDPPRAVQVLQQHRQLYPDFGPDPWGPRLRAIERQLRPEEAES